MFQSIDSMEKLLNDEKTADPSVVPDTNVLDLQAVVSRLERLERAIVELAKTDTSADTLSNNNNDSGGNGADNNDNTEE